MKEPFPLFFPYVRFTNPILRPSFILKSNSGKIKKICDRLNRMLYFDACDVHSIKVFRDERGEYWLYYNGPPRKHFKRHSGIGLATSKDGIFFTKHPKNPLIKPSLHWDSKMLWKCSPLKMGVNDFRLYYGATSEEGIQNIGVAFSSDGIRWEKFRDPVLCPEVEKGEKGVGNPTVMYDSDKGLFIMLYLILPSKTIGLAYSSDCVRWKKYRDNPVISPLPQSFEESFIAPFYLLKKGNIYMLLYEGKRSDKKEDWMIGMAYSSDLVNWRRDNRNPILRPGIRGNFDELFVSDPSMVIDRDILRLYYGAKNINGVGCGGLALIPLKPNIEGYFRVEGRALNNHVMDAGEYSDGVICEGWERKNILFTSDTAGMLTIQVINHGSWQNYECVRICPNKTARYLLSDDLNGEIQGMRIIFDTKAKVTAKWVLEKPKYIFKASSNFM